MAGQRDGAEPKRDWVPEGPSPLDRGTAVRNQESEPMGRSPPEGLWFAFRKREEEETIRRLTPP